MLGNTALKPHASFHQINSKDVFTRFTALKLGQFTGKVLFKAVGEQSWVIYMFLGRVLYATGGVHPVRRWQRNLKAHAPQLEAEQLTKTLGLLSGLFTKTSNICREYQILLTLVREQKLTREQAATIVRGNVAEVLFDIVQASKLAYQLQSEHLSTAQVVLIDPEQLGAEVKQQWATWCGANLAKVSPNKAPVIVQSEQLHQKVSDDVHQRLSAFLNGQNSLRDLATNTRQNVLSLTQSVFPYVQAGMVDLIDIPDLSPPSLQSTEEIPSKLIVSNAFPEPAPVNPTALPMAGKKRLVVATSVPITIVGLSLLLLMVGGYVFWRNQTHFSAANDTRLTPTIATASNSDIQLYPQMRDVPNVPSGLFNYGGAIVFAPLRSQSVVDAIAKAQPQFQLRYVDPAFGRPGAHKGVAMLLDNELSFSQNAISLDDAEYSRAKERGFRLQEVPVGINGIVFYTHPSLKIAGLSMNQLRDIFTGKLTNWRQVGGPDLRIVPIGIDPKDSSTFKILLSDVGGPSSARVRVVRDWTACIRETSVIPGGISFGSMATAIRQRTVRPLALAKGSSNQYVSPYIADGQVNSQAIRDGSYPFTYPIFVDIRRDGTSNEQAGVAYVNLLLSGEGQKLVEQAGFVPLH